MNISFDKAILWILPYFYLVSIVYYWGYWGTFDIDAFNYYAVTDLVKGITGPFRSIIYYSVAAFTIYEGSELVKKIFKADNSKNIWKVLLTSILAFSAFVTVFMIASTYLIIPFTWRHASSNEAARLYVLQGLAFVAATFATGAIYKKKWTLYTWATIMVVLLPAQAFLGAKETALLIAENKEFDYVISDSLSVPNKKIYKYLGKSGEFQLLLTQDNLQRIIVPVDKLTPLVLENYSVEDTASIRRLSAYQKGLVAPSPQQKPPQPSK